MPFARGVLLHSGDDANDEDMMLKSAMLIGTFMVVALPAAADVCVWSPKAAADAAVKALPKGTTIMEFCASCGDKMAKGTYVLTAAAEPIPESTDNEFYVKVNGVERDLAYVFILGGRNKKDWVNLGLQVKCSKDARDFDTKVLAAKFIPLLPPVDPSKVPN